MIVIYITLLILLILNNDISITSVEASSYYWFHTLVPTLGPAMLLSSLISDDYYYQYLTTCLHKLLPKRLFPTPTILSLFILSYISGTPASIHIIKNKFSQGQITHHDAKTLIYSCQQMSLPYIIHILSAFNIPIHFYLVPNIAFSLLVLTLRNTKTTSQTYKTPKTTSTLLTYIPQVINTLLNILAITIIFNILINMFNPPHFITPYLEVINGNRILMSLEINKRLKEIITLTSLSLLSVSIHMQILQIYNDFSYLKFIAHKLLLILFILLHYYIWCGICHT